MFSSPFSKSSRIPCLKAVYRPTKYEYFLRQTNISMSKKNKVTTPPIFISNQAESIPFCMFCIFSSLHACLDSQFFPRVSTQHDSPFLCEQIGSQISQQSQADASVLSNLFLISSNPLYSFIEGIINETEITRQRIEATRKILKVRVHWQREEHRLINSNNNIIKRKLEARYRRDLIDIHQFLVRHIGQVFFVCIHDLMHWLWKQ